MNSKHSYIENQKLYKFYVRQFDHSIVMFFISHVTSKHKVTFFERNEVVIYTCDPFLLPGKFTMIVDFLIPHIGLNNKNKSLNLS